MKMTRGFLVILQNTGLSGTAVPQLRMYKMTFELPMFIPFS